MKLINVLVIIGICLAATVSAEAGVLVEPDRHIVLLSPGETKTVEYKIHNSGAEPLSIEIDPKDWGSAKIPVSSWLRLERQRLEVRPGKTSSFEAVVTAPDKAEGEMLAMLFLCYKEHKDSALNIRNGIPLYLVIKGTQRYAAAIEKIGIEYIAAEDMVRPGLNIMVSVKNTGNIHIVPAITISAEDTEGKTIETLSQKGSKRLLRGQSDSYRFRMQDYIFAEGDYTITARVGYEDKMEPVEKGVKCSISDGKMKILEREAGS